MSNTNKTMTILELQKILGERIRITLSDDLTPEQRKIENEQSALVMNMGKQLINGADLVLRYETLEAKSKSLTNSNMSKVIGEWID